MEITTFTHDIKVFYIPADSFPAGIMNAYDRLYALVPFSTSRKFFGISRPEHGTIIYKAAAEESFPGEAEKFQCETLILKKGNYVYQTINDFMKDTQRIGNAFNELLTHADVDPDGYCVEWYFNEKDVKCMVRLRGEG